MRYFIRARISRNYNASIEKEQDFLVLSVSDVSYATQSHASRDATYLRSQDPPPDLLAQSPTPSPPVTATPEAAHVVQSPPTPFIDPVKLEVGIEDCLHIEFEFNKRGYHLQVRERGEGTIPRLSVGEMSCLCRSRDWAGLGWVGLGHS